MAWKKTMQVFHTAGDPPSIGRIILPIIGSMRNSRSALAKRVDAKTTSMSRGNGATSSGAGQGVGGQVSVYPTRPVGGRERKIGPGEGRGVSADPDGRGGFAGPGRSYVARPYPTERPSLPSAVRHGRHRRLTAQQPFDGLARRPRPVLPAHLA